MKIIKDLFKYIFQFTKILLQILLLLFTNSIFIGKKGKRKEIAPKLSNFDNFFFLISKKSHHIDRMFEN